MSAREDLLALVAAHESGAGAAGHPHLDPAAVDATLARRAAVLVLFGVLDDVPAESDKPYAAADLDLLLLERAHTLNSHPGQVAFPGGGIDSGGEAAVEAALREAEEETGLDPSGVEILGVLPELGLIRSNFLVRPVLAWWAAPSPVRVVDYGESAQVFRIPVRDLLDPANRVTATITAGGQTHKSPAFLVRDVVVWGFTGMILNELFEQLGWAVPWDRDREYPILL
ncbi:CoA pyrophosphatase [Pseudarthrobacter sp. J75]|uniref:NUDIX hydrolase n=1 Tax=unclassified Pseudarthrobacter TaxID=2647000 RepID=UPI002E81EDDE|nr:MULTISPECIES: CoA pyrophosphatase [unclassified Pseudarthrobacter]MEE2522274.1 CoA pyrophosphatase [Pseudarthrobacter sp. J47]MEE2528080.1 CoA pyrophosphatase [Pseudarthrobacter sp. J75]